MEDGGLRMESQGWRIAGRKGGSGWRIEDGESRMEDRGKERRIRMEDRRLRIKDREWRIED
jgi:hypothetical protein